MFTNHTDEPIYNLEYRYFVHYPPNDWEDRRDFLSLGGLRTDSVPVIDPNSDYKEIFVVIGAYNFGETHLRARLMDPENPGQALCETAADPLWGLSRGTAEQSAPAAVEYKVATTLENPEAGEEATFVATVTVGDSDSRRGEHLTQTCVNLRFEGFEPDHDSVIFYDSPNGKYAADGSLSDRSSVNSAAGGKPRSSRLEYDYDGVDEDFGVVGRRPQCSDANGKFEGALFRIGRTVVADVFDDTWPLRTPATYVVKVPVPATTGDGPHCMTATVRALPVEGRRGDANSWERAQDNTDRVCLGAPPASDGLTCSPRAAPTC